MSHIRQVKWQKKALALTFRLKGEPTSLLSLHTELQLGAHRNIPSYQGSCGDFTRKCVFVAEITLSSHLSALPPELIATTFTSSSCPSPCPLSSGPWIVSRGRWPLPGLAHDCFPCDCFSFHLLVGGAYSNVEATSLGSWMAGSLLPVRTTCSGRSSKILLC